jgi:nitrilase
VPTDITESTFLLGECVDETVGTRDNGVDDCSIPERWRDNPREALKGLPTVTEQYDESRTIEAGGEAVAFDSPVGRVGLSICYDLRFPELYRSMGPVDLLVVPAAFTHTTGQAHWELLLRARAVENLCYVLASAQGGTHPSGRRTWGDSMVVDPWGAVLERLAQGPGVVTAEIDPARIAELRASLPALAHRKL